MFESDICGLQNAGATPRAGAAHRSGTRDSGRRRPPTIIQARNSVSPDADMQSAPAPPSYDRTLTSAPFSCSLSPPAGAIWSSNEVRPTDQLPACR